MGTVDKLTELQYRRSVINNGGGEVKIKKQHDFMRTGIKLSHVRKRMIICITYSKRWRNIDIH